MLIRLAAPLLLFAAVAQAAPNQAGDWKVGLGRAKITPSEPVLMGGYASRLTPFAGIDADIWVKAAAFEDSAGKVAVLVTADMLGYRQEHVAEIAARLKQSHNLDRADLLLNSSHSHAGPLVDATRIHEFTDNPAYRAAVERYVPTMIDATVRAARQALDHRSPATLAWGQGSVGFPYNRREPTPKGIIIGVNPRGPVDRSVPVMRVQDDDGKTLAVIFGTATHPASLRGDNFRISGDYAGFAQDAVEAALPGVQAMFVLGCAGDSVPHPRGSLPLARQYGDQLATEVQSLVNGELAPVNGPLQTRFRMVDLPLQRLSRAQVEREAQTRYHVYYGERALDWLDSGRELPAVYPAPFALWRFGEGLTLVAFSGETVVDYALAAERMLGPLNLWLAGYSNEVFGYLPSARLLKEGGYETRGVIGNRPGLFAPEAEAAVLKAIEEMARSVGRADTGRVPSREPVD